MNFKSKFWLKISLINLLIVAIIGVLMRYKIGFEFPYLNQKNLQLSHSNFAFSGWISHTLMVLMVHFLERKTKHTTCRFTKKYNKILSANLICSYGMLVFFIIRGYGLFSIFFSTITLLISYFFAYYFIKDLKEIPNQDLSKKWFKAAIFFNVISSFGTLTLAYMMTSKSIYQEEYLASMYYYLHFQYNGWFFFSCMGLLFAFLDLRTSQNAFYSKTFNLFFISCIPAYFLSTLWMKIPAWLYAITIIAALVQVYTWFRFLRVLIKTRKEYMRNIPRFLRYILLFIGFVLSIKFLLQLGITIPTLSQLAFGFRPIVIAYLHLVLLAFVSLFLLFYIFATNQIFINKPIKIGIIIFTIGVLFNEIILAIQGIACFGYIVIPYANVMLFEAAIMMTFGIGITTIYTIKKGKYFGTFRFTDL